MNSDFMERVYIIALGGTGARVLKALTMLLSAGALPNYEIVPIIIDFDRCNGDVKQTLDLLNRYKTIQNRCQPAQEIGFFNSSLLTIGELHHGIANQYSFMVDIPIHHDMNIGHLLGYHSLVPQTPFQQLLDSLITPAPMEEMDYNMVIGCGGNAKLARLGYAALGIEDTFEFRTFLNCIIPNRDKVVVVGSTFGSTGSVGILEVLKGLKNHTRLINNVATFFVTPYFIPMNNPPFIGIDYKMVFDKRSDDFFRFYKEIGLDCIVNTSYNIGANDCMIVENRDGDLSQRNLAHSVELLTAMTICAYVQTGQQGHFDYCLGQDNLQFINNSIGINDFHYLPNGWRILSCLASFLISAKFYNEYLNDNSRKTDYFYRSLQQQFISERSAAETLHDVFSEFSSWIKEMSIPHHNKYNIDVFEVDEPLENLIKNHPYNHHHGGLFHFLHHDIIRDFIKEMNTCFHSMNTNVVSNGTDPDQVLIQLLSHASCRIYQNFNL